MIGAITGILLHKAPSQILVDVHGVGYELEISMHTYTQLPAIGERVSLRTHLQVREDAHILFGFAHEAERMAYRQLVRVNGVGARTALAILSTFTVAQLSQAVNARDVKLLTKVPGIGGKTAERLLVELKDRFNVPFDDMGSSNLFAPSAQSISAGQEVRSALIALGYKEAEVNLIMKSIPDPTTVEDGIRQALKALSK